MLCVAHLLHNCAIKVKSHFEDLDRLITKENTKLNKPKFATIGCLPQPVTRSGSWLNATLYYAKNLPKVKPIVQSFEESGILATQANISLQTTGVATHFLKLKHQHKCLIKLIEILESVKYNIKKKVQAIQELDLKENTCSINRYISKKNAKQ